MMGNHKVIDPQTVASAYPVVGAGGHALPKRRSPSSPDSVAAQIARGIADVIAAGEISIADGVTLASILGRSRTGFGTDPEQIHGMFGPTRDLGDTTSMFANITGALTGGDGSDQAYGYVPGMPASDSSDLVGLVLGAFTGRGNRLGLVSDGADELANPFGADKSNANPPTIVKPGDDGFVGWGAAQLGAPRGDPETAAAKLRAQAEPGHGLADPRRPLPSLPDVPGWGFPSHDQDSPMWIGNFLDNSSTLETVHQRAEAASATMPGGPPKEPADPDSGGTAAQARALTPRWMLVQEQRRNRHRLTAGPGGFQSEDFGRATQPASLGFDALSLVGLDYQRRAEGLARVLSLAEIRAGSTAGGGRPVPPALQGAVAQAIIQAALGKPSI